MEKLKKITDAELKSGVQALADRPNFASKYGTGGLSAQDLKKHFDKLVVLLAERYNALCEALQSTDASKYIGLSKLSDNVFGDLDSLVASFASGYFASEVLRLKPDATAEELQSLQAVIYGICEAIAKNAEAARNALDEHDKENEETAAQLAKEIADGTLSDKLKTGFAKGAINYALWEALKYLKDGKLDRKTTPANPSAGDVDSRAYIETFDGKQELMRISQTLPDTIVKRDTNGALWVPNESMLLPNHAVNKNYADSNFANRLAFRLDRSTYELAWWLYNAKNEILYGGTIDFPLESMVVDASYADGILKLKLQNGNEVAVEISQIVSGLVPETRKVNNKDLKDDISLTASDVGAYSKEEVDAIKEDIDKDVGGKLDRAGAGSYTRLYGVDNKGNQTLHVMRIAPAARSIVQRGDNQEVQVPLVPTADKHAASKKYVDDIHVELLNVMSEQINAVSCEVSGFSLNQRSLPVMEIEVEDTFTERQTANGLSIVDRSVTRVTRISGDTVSKMPDGLVYGGDIYGVDSSYGEIFFTDKAAVAAGVLPSNSPEIEDEGGYRVWDDFSVDTYGGNYSYENAVAEGFYFCVQNWFGGFADGDVICRVGDSWRLVNDTLENARFQKIRSTSQDGARQSELALGEPVELGKWDVLDMEQGIIERRTVIETRENAWSDEELMHRGNYILSSDRLTVAYESDDLVTESIECPTEYVAYSGGREALLENESDVCRTPCTVTQRYYVQNGG